MHAMNLVDFLDDPTLGTLYMHLSTAALVQPYALSTMQEATFLGYHPAILQTINQAPNTQGFRCFSGSVTFNFFGPQESVTLNGAWVTARTPTEEFLIYVLELVGTEYDHLALGNTTWQINFAGFLLPSQGP